MDGKEASIKCKGFWLGFQIKEKDIFGEYKN